MFLSNTIYGTEEKLREEGIGQGEAGKKSRCREKARKRNSGRQTE